MHGTVVEKPIRPTLQNICGHQLQHFRANYEL